MKKEQVEYEVNLIGETELSAWSDEVVDLLTEMFIKELPIGKSNCDNDGKNIN